MSSRPNSATVRVVASSTSAASATLARIATARPPVATILAVVSSAASARRSTTATAAPSSANSSAAARPMPEPAPVTSATRPSNLPVMIRPLLSGLWSQRGPAAVDRQGVAGEVAEPVRGEQRDGVGHVFGLGDAAQRDLRLHLGAQLRYVQPPLRHGSGD